ncbi:(2E,6E)-farnesyl diphosphate synthase [Pontibacterium sp.]|uniref:(2E,6E)-farnesyl diphosphate synthase n=1 Tax=Pontibacterium sp. TaxID=2036026 RepID=UPI003515FE4B
MTIKNTLKQYQQRVDAYLDQTVLKDSIEPRLQEAMRYALFNGGKRVRPILVYLVNQMLGGKLEDADAPAAAIECVHSYSLVHDDLPAMDDDDLRRGKPTCHIAFDEATAILAGDALQCFGFELLTQDEEQPNRNLKMVKVLAKASGDSGMVVGQAFDLANVGKSLTLEQLEAMHAHKTGALLNAAVDLGALSSGCNDNDTFAQLRRYGDAIGLAFQVKDDILDIEGDTETIGKPQGSDVEQDKPTYPALLGMDGAKEKLRQLHQEAVAAVQPFGDAAQPLVELADFIVNRDH